jgi:hypothetical protein
VVFNDRMWVMGGNDGTRDLNDVWYSRDGTIWTLATAHAGWSPRDEHSSVVFGDKMWVIGGNGGDVSTYGKSNDVWASEDGVNWTEVAETTSWWPRSDHASVVYDNRIWILGGDPFYIIYGKLSDVWYSYNGRDWRLATAYADWPVRSGHAAAVFQDRIWILGGAINGGRYTSSYLGNDIWFTAPEADATNWKSYP